MLGKEILISSQPLFGPVCRGSVKLHAISGPRRALSRGYFLVHWIIPNLSLFTKRNKKYVSGYALSRGQSKPWHLTDSLLFCLDTWNSAPEEWQTAKSQAGFIGWGKWLHRCVKPKKSQNQAKSSCVPDHTTIFQWDDHRTYAPTVELRLFLKGMHTDD